MRWSRIRLQLFLGSILEVLFVGSALTFCVACALTCHLHLFSSDVCYARPPMLLIFWPIGPVLSTSASTFPLPMIFPLTYLVFSIWMHRLFLMSGASNLTFYFIFSWLFLFFFSFPIEVLVYASLLTYTFQFLIYIIGKSPT